MRKSIRFSFVLVFASILLLWSMGCSRYDAPVEPQPLCEPGWIPHESGKFCIPDSLSFQLEATGAWQMLQNAERFQQIEGMMQE